MASRTRYAQGGAQGSGHREAWPTAVVNSCRAQGTHKVAHKVLAVGGRGEEEEDDVDGGGGRAGVPAPLASCVCSGAWAYHNVFTL